MCNSRLRDLKSNNYYYYITQKAEIKNETSRKKTMVCQNI